MPSDAAPSLPWRHRITRRALLGAGARTGVAAGLAVRFGLRSRTAAALDPRERRTLRAALARMIPAGGDGDWSAADVGADRYIERLLSGRLDIYAGGPYRRDFPEFQAMAPVKRRGWRRRIRRLRRLYRDGLAELDRRAGGDFASAPAPVQDAVLASLDDERHPFFAPLYNHTMEGVYAHPVYGGNRGSAAWRDLGYQGDVHGVRFPGIGPPDASWNRYGGYAPQEMVRPGEEP
jgi:gluconate 2-dehydrogenase gamma chain